MATEVEYDPTWLQLTSWRQEEILEILENIPELMKHVREERGLSYNAAGKDSGIYPSTFQTLEKGLHDPNLRTLIKILRWAEV